jgi:hypothetical protein
VQKHAASLACITSDRKHLILAGQARLFCIKLSTAARVINLVLLQELLLFPGMEFTGSAKQPTLATCPFLLFQVH